MLPGDASVTRQAISAPRSAKAASTAARSLKGSTRVAAVEPAGTPGVPGTALSRR